MKTLPFDPADYLDTPEAQQELLDDAAASGDGRYIAAHSERSPGRAA